MSREGQLAKNTLIISFGTFLPKIINVITLPIITAFLTKVEYGQYDLITTMVILVLPIATLQVQSAAFRFLIDCRNDKAQTKRVITTILLYVSFASIVSVMVIFFALQSITIELRIMVCLYFLVDMLLVIIQQIVRGMSLNKAYSVSTILNSIINLIGIFVAVQYMGKGLLGVLFSMVVASMAAIGFLFWRISLWLYIDWSCFSFDTLKEILSYSWPMIPNNLSNWVLKLSDRLVITAVLGVEANAVYAVANKIPNLFVAIQSTFIYAWQENASLAMNDRDAEDYYSNIFSSVFNILVGIMALAVAATPVMFATLIRGDYSEAYNQMPILFIGMMFSSIASVLGGVYIAHKRTKNVGITTVLAATCNLVIDLACVHLLGITAGSVSTLISYLFLSIYRMVDVQKFQRIKYNYKSILGWLFVICVMCFICEINLFWLNILNCIIGVVVAFISNNKLIRSIMLKISGRNAY